MTAATVLACLAVAVCALAYAEDRSNELARERIRRQESEIWAERFEGEAETLRCENARLRNQLATLQHLHSERTRELLAQNYPVIAANATWKRRRQQ